MSTLRPGDLVQTTCRYIHELLYSPDANSPVVTSGLLFPEDVCLLICVKPTVEHDDEMGYAVHRTYCWLFIPRLNQCLWTTDFNLTLV